MALATAFVLMRLLYVFLPALHRSAQLARVYLNRAKQLFDSLKAKLQEGAMNAKAWASKSLATVSFGDASTSRVVPVS